MQTVSLQSYWVHRFVLQEEGCPERSSSLSALKSDFSFKLEAGFEEEKQEKPFYSHLGS